MQYLQERSTCMVYFSLGLVISKYKVWPKNHLGGSFTGLTPHSHLPNLIISAPPNRHCHMLPYMLSLGPLHTVVCINPILLPSNQYLIAQCSPFLLVVIVVPTQWWGGSVSNSVVGLVSSLAFYSALSSLSHWGVPNPSIRQCGTAGSSWQHLKG